MDDEDELDRKEKWQKVGIGGMKERKEASKFRLIVAKNN